MRTLPADLLAAQRSASAEPQVDVVIENSMAGMRRLDVAQLDATANTIAKHDVCVAGDGSVTRVRSDGAGSILRQRNATPGIGSGYAAVWSSLASGKGNQIACAARGSRVAIVYIDAAGTGIKIIESLDSGATFGGENAVVTAAAAAADLAVAYKSSSGDLAIAWATATTLNIIKRASGVFGAASGSGASFSSLNGVAMAYGFDYDLVVTGVEVTTLKPSLWTIIYGDGSDAPVNTWGALNPQQQAESDASITYKAPSLAVTDAYRVDFVEADAFTGGNTRVYRTTMHPAMTFAAGPFTLRTPVPVNYAGAEGLALAADSGGSGFLYESAPDAVFRAPLSQVTATVTPSVLAAQIDDTPHGTSGWIDIDNASGAYAGPPPPIDIGNLVGIAWGYRTASGLLSSRMADLWIASYEYRRGGGRSVLRLHVEGGWEMLRRNRQRAQIVHTADTYLTILQRIFSRAGLQLTSSSVSTRAQTVTPKFTIAPDASGFDAVLRALAFLADRIRMRTIAGATITEPLASAASDYTFGVAHPLREVALAAAPPAVNEAQVLGANAFGESIDFTNAALSLGARQEQRDLTSATGAAAAATAVAHLRQRALDVAAGSVVVPPNCGQELLDAIDFTDALISPTAIKRRVAEIRWRYDRRRAVYEQTIGLGAM
jgi:hypothetical protein